MAKKKTHLEHKPILPNGIPSQCPSIPETSLLLAVFWSEMWYNFSTTIAKRRRQETMSRTLVEDLRFYQRTAKDVVCYSNFSAELDFKASIVTHKINVQELVQQQHTVNATYAAKQQEAN